MKQLDARVLRGETPSDHDLVVLGVPGFKDGAKLRQRCDALIQRLSRKDGELDLGDVEPTAVLWCEMNLEALYQASGFRRLESFVECCQRVGAQVVHDEDDALGCGVLFVRESTEELGEIDGRPPLGGLSHDTTCERLDGHEDVASSATTVLVVNSRGHARRRRDRNQHVIQQLLAGFVDAHLRPEGIAGLVVHVQDVLHGVYEGATV
jgi:hypothetical protein